MQVVQTAGLPPYQGRMYLPIRGWTWKRRNELRKIVRAWAAKLVLRATQAPDLPAAWKKIVPSMTSVTALVTIPKGRSTTVARPFVVTAAPVPR